MRHVFETMGTVASIVVPNTAAPLLSAIEAVCADVDGRFSLYRPDSELSRVARGELALTQSSDAVRTSYARAMQWSIDTSGAFSPHRPDGVLDLNGIVKAEAIEQVGLLLHREGHSDWSVNLGGDILQSGSDAAGPWITGIADPADEKRLLMSVHLSGSRRAIATSGSAQRGDHIWRGDRTVAPSFVQVSVIADDIVTADVLATAIVSGGTDALDDLADRNDIDVLAIDRTGAMLATPGFRASMGRGRMGE